jgi:NADH-quinone oxidoreductase subunit N
VSAGEVPLAVIGVLMSVVSVYYYLRIPVLMYMREPSGAEPRMELATGEAVVLGVCAVGVIYLGILPNGSLPLLGELHVLDWARDSIALLFASI